MSKLLSSLILGLVLAVTPARAQVENHKPAPEFTLKDTNGSDVSLSQFKGSYVVLEWLNYDCPFVKKHYSGGNMQNLQKTYTGKGVAWLSILSSAPGKEGYYPPEEINKMNQEKSGAPTAILLDPAGEAGKLYAAQTTPHMFVINPDGVLIYQGAIDDIKSVDPDDAAKAENYVSAALNEAMAGKAVTTPSTKSYGCSVKY